MTNEELKAIRLRAYGAPEDRGYDVPPLLAYIDELHGVVHDLRQEPGYALGRQDVLREVLNVLGKVPVTWDADHTTAVADPQSLAIVLDLIERLGPVAPHLAPDDLRRENEALRAALQRLVNADSIGSPTRRMLEMHQSILDARRLLGEV
jgi:hypothetical protein